jgi:hypothetical protein
LQKQALLALNRSSRIHPFEERDSVPLFLGLEWITACQSWGEAISILSRSNLSAKERSCSPYSISDEIEASLDLNWKIIFVDLRKSTVFVSHL